MSTVVVVSTIMVVSTRCALSPGFLTIPESEPGMALGNHASGFKAHCRPGQDAAPLNSPLSSSLASPALSKLLCGRHSCLDLFNKDLCPLSSRLLLCRRRRNDQNVQCLGSCHLHSSSGWRVG